MFLFGTKSSFRLELHCCGTLVSVSYRLSTCIQLPRECLERTGSFTLWIGRVYAKTLFYLWFCGLGIKGKLCRVLRAWISNRITRYTVHFFLPTIDTEYIKDDVLILHTHYITHIFRCQHFWHHIQNNYPSNIKTYFRKLIMKLFFRT